MPLLLLATTLFAQEPDPFGNDPKPAAEPGAKAPAEPAPKKTEDDLIVRTVRESNPTTPAQLVKAANVMLDYGRSDEAKKYLKSLADQKLDGAGLVKLHQEVGGGVLFRFLRATELDPIGKQLATAVNDAVDAYRRDPARLDSQIRELNDPSAGVRGAALAGLKKAGDHAVTPMIQALADPARAKEHPNIRSAMLLIGPTTFAYPLIGTLDSPNDSLRVQAMEVLGRMEFRDALDHLVEPSTSDNPVVAEAARTAINRLFGRTPTRGQAERYLQKKAIDYFEGRPVAAPDYEDKIEFWTWDNARQQAVSRRYPYKDASQIHAGRLSSALYKINPKNTDYRRMFLVSMLEGAKISGGLGEPLVRGKDTPFQQAGDVGPDALEDALVYGMKTGHIPGVAAIAEVMGASANESFLQSSGGQPRPLVLATRHADRRLRFAATMAILEINPRQTFSGASYVADALGYFAGSYGSQRVLMGDPRIADGQAIVAMCAEIGFDCETALTGRQLFTKAAQNPDLECILISSSIDFPRYGEVVQTLRRDPTTAKVPIGILAYGEELEKARRFADQFPYVTAFPKPIETEDASREIRELQATLGRDLIPRDERLAQATAALTALERMYEQPGQHPFDVAKQESSVILASATPELAIQACRVLGLIATPKAQQVLVDLASQNVRPLEERDAAVKAFAVAVDRKGVKLNSTTILRQYSIYNFSENQTLESQGILSQILDTIEGPSKKAAAAK